uniref:Leucine-rich repeat-containing protein 41 n=1 Tax=Geotrypetes seraphini TaxID=260995 RepID=A0A6P8NL98_GEOSA|nr:leucine-rich repeat-containing protein 41 isoform X4 [Geotrypetes seraphini]
MLQYSQGCSSCSCRGLATLSAGLWGGCQKNDGPRMLHMLALPSTILQHLLPLLNIYYLERIEETAVKKGLSTEPVWCQIWKRVMKRKPSQYENIRCWRQKFLETFFHNIMRGILDMSSDTCLQDPRFSPLLHSARYVTELTIGNKLQGVTRLGPVLGSLVDSVKTLKFLHLRSADKATEYALRLLLHCLIHHGKVCKISLSSWPTPDQDLLVVILKISAGLWRQTSDCKMCVQEQDAESSGSAQENRLPQCVESQESSHMQAPSGGNSENKWTNEKPPSALLNLHLPDVDQKALTKVSTKSGDNAVATDIPAVPALIGSISRNAVCHQSSLNKVPPPTSQSSNTSAIPSANNSSYCGGDAKAEQDELFDFVFAVAQEEMKKLQDGNTQLAEENAGNGGALSEAAQGTTDLPPPLKIRYHFRSVTSLNLHNVVLSLESCHFLCHLLCSWVSLEALMMAYNANQLKQLEIQFPRGLLKPKHLLSLLGASSSLEKLILDSATFPSPEDLRVVLRALSELNPTLKKLYLHELNLSGCKSEVLLLLQSSTLEEVTFSFCQLFERRLDGFLIELINTVKKNRTLTILNLRGNRLGDEGLVSLADIFSEDSVSSIQHMDISSNCIKPAGLIQFAKKLEKSREQAGRISLTHLNLSQNLLNRDLAITQEALQALRKACTVIDHSSDFSQVFADHISVM